MGFRYLESGCTQELHIDSGAHRQPCRGLLRCRGLERCRLCVLHVLGFRHCGLLCGLRSRALVSNRGWAPFGHLRVGRSSQRYICRDAGRGCVVGAVVAVSIL